MFNTKISHITLRVSDLKESSTFYAKYAGMDIVHWRHDTDGGADVVWLTDRATPFGVILIESDLVEAPLFPTAHLGVACESRAEVDRLCADAARDDALVKAPVEWGYPLGYWALLRDPDGHLLALSYGHRVGVPAEDWRGARDIGWTGNGWDRASP